jgi:hypothetical protein
MSDKPPHWPADVEPLVIEEFEKLGRNARNELFWDGRRLISRSQYLFTWPQVGLAVLAAMASLATVATGLNNASIFLCARGHAWLGCPIAPATMPPAIAAPAPASPSATSAPPAGRTP